MTSRILIVDDEREMRNLIKTCLQHKGFEVDEAVSADNALSGKYIRRGNYIYGIDLIKIK